MRPLYRSDLRYAERWAMRDRLNADRAARKPLGGYVPNWRVLNPEHRPEGRLRYLVKHPVTGALVKMLGPRNPSRYLPHSSSREAARRLRQ